MISDDDFDVLAASPRDVFRDHASHAIALLSSRPTSSASAAARQAAEVVRQAEAAAAQTLAEAEVSAARVRHAAHAEATRLQEVAAHNSGATVDARPPSPSCSASSSISLEPKILPPFSPILTPSRLARPCDDDDNVDYAWHFASVQASLRGVLLAPAESVDVDDLTSEVEEQFTTSEAFPMLGGPKPSTGAGTGRGKQLEPVDIDDLVHDFEEFLATQTERDTQAAILGSPKAKPAVGRGKQQRTRLSRA
jgi:hypothetical protein